MFDWKSASDDPNNARALTSWTAFYDGISELVDLAEIGKSRDEFVLSLLDRRGRVLDIGFAEHTAGYVGREAWFHKQIRDLGATGEVWGMDINEALVEQIRARFGWDHLVAWDATTTPVREGYFDTIHAGDVIEHVSDVGGFLAFCHGSLKAGGRLVISTPNPHSWRFVKWALRTGTSPTNCEHTCWITPPNLNELCRRSGLEFLRSFYLINRPKRRLARLVGTRRLRGMRDFVFAEYLFLVGKPPTS
jgi:SAM-dependent methyltransferase